MIFEVVHIIVAELRSLLDGEAGLFRLRVSIQMLGCAVQLKCPSRACDAADVYLAHGCERALSKLDGRLSFGIGFLAVGLYE